MGVRFLHTNDFHGALTPGLADLINGMRTQDTIVLDSGDCIKTGNLGIPLGIEPAWGLLHDAGCEIGTIGNRETHLLESAFAAKLNGNEHRLLCGNLHRRDGGPDPLSSTHIIERDGIRVGFLGVSVAMVTEKMASKAVSAYIWEPPVPAAVQLAHELRPQVDVLCAITHIGFAQDKLLAEACPLIDIVFGGHSHTVLEKPQEHGGVWIAQGGSHARFIGDYEWNAETRTLYGGLKPLKNP